MIHKMATIRPASSSILRHISRSSYTSRSTTQIRSYSAPGEGTVPPNKIKYVPTSGSYPKGFVCASAHVGVKASNTRYDDLALVASEVPCSAAATFTRNKFQAAPVTVSRDVLTRRSGEGVRAVIVNSGCANAVTGKGGIEDAVKMGEETDRLFDEEFNGDGKGSRTIVMSTGVIGQRYIQLSHSHEPSLTIADYLSEKYSTRSLPHIHH